MFLLSIESGMFSKWEINTLILKQQDFFLNSLGGESLEFSTH